MVSIVLPSKHVGGVQTLVGQKEDITAIDCQALSLSLLSFSERELTLLSLCTTPPPPQQTFSEKIGLIRVTYDPPVSAEVNIYLSLT